MKILCIHISDLPGKFSPTAFICCESPLNFTQIFSSIMGSINYYLPLRLIRGPFYDYYLIRKYLYAYCDDKGRAEYLICHGEM